MGTSESKSNTSYQNSTNQKFIPKRSLPSPPNLLHFDKKAKSMEHYKSNVFCTPNQISSIRKVLPHESRQHNEWHLFYSAALYGFSIITFEHHVLYHGPVLIFIKDTEGGIFGGYVSTSLDKKSDFFGTQDCFLFSLKGSDGHKDHHKNDNTKEQQQQQQQQEEEEDEDDDDESESEPWNIYRATSKNSHYVYFNSDSKYKFNGIGFGGHLDFFSLCIQQNLSEGRTRSDLLTFGSPPCISGKQPNNNQSHDFKISEIEVWGFPLSESVKIDLVYRERQRNGYKDLVEDAKVDLMILKTAGSVKESENAVDANEKDEQKSND